MEKILGWSSLLKGGRKLLKDAVTIVALLLVASTAVQANSLSGRVIRLADGQGVPGVSVILSRRADDGNGADIITVFTGEDGEYHFPDDVSASSLSGASLSVRALGYQQLSPEASPFILSQNDEKKFSVNFTVKIVNDLSANAPASAWLAKIPESNEKDFVRLQCIGCHQFPTPKVMQYSKQIEAGAVAMGMADEESSALVRKESWEAIVKYMRARMYDIFPDGTNIDIAKLAWHQIQANETTLFNAEDGKLIAEFAATHMPRSYDALTGYDYGAELGVSTKTVIREYTLPDTSFVREVAMTTGSPYVWGADLQKNRLLRLDPQTGKQDWFYVPSDMPTGPHTIVGDYTGNLWIAMMEGDVLAKYTPEKNDWKLWSLREDFDGAAAVGSEAMVHDLTFDKNYKLAQDKNGNIWLTLIGHNKMASLNPDTGVVNRYDAVQIEGRSPISISLYGTLLSDDGTCAWYAQLVGVVACFNTETHENESVIEFSEGSGPRRMAIDADGILWIPLFGSGKLVKYDTNARKLLNTYDLPDLSAAPYSVTWDPKRNIIWCANSNVDAIYGFDPKSETFSVLPLPRGMGYLRRIEVDENTGDLVTTYANIPTGSGPSKVVIIEVGD